MNRLRSPLLTSSIKQLELNGKAPMPSQQREDRRRLEAHKSEIKSWQRLQRMHLIRGERSE